MKDKLVGINCVDNTGNRLLAIIGSLPFSIALSISKKRVVGCSESFDRILYNIDSREYQLFDFANKTSQQKAEYITLKDRLRLMDCLNHDNDASLLLDNKFMTYCVFNKYYHRDVQLIASRDDSEIYFSFLDSHNNVFFKPLGKSHGDNVTHIDAEMYSPEAFENLIQKGPFLLEEAIDQDEIMAAFHPKSVNTVRLTTYYDRERDICSIVFALLRIGIGNSIVDNSSAGGIITNIDPLSGVVDTLGYKRDRTRYEVHPDTGHPILNAEIPKWNELMDIVEKVARVLPEIPIIGWDFALSKRGWCIVEANQKPSFQSVQVLQDRGLRSILNRLQLQKSYREDLV